MSGDESEAEISRANVADCLISLPLTDSDDPDEYRARSILFRGYCP